MLDPSTQAACCGRAQIAKALAHPTRLFILDQLGRKPCCVSDLTEMIGDDVSTVSKHLAVLKAAGLVRDARRGSQVFYSQKDPAVQDLIRALEAARLAFAGTPAELRRR